MPTPTGRILVFDARAGKGFSSAEVTEDESQAVQDTSIIFVADKLVHDGWGGGNETVQQPCLLTTEVPSILAKVQASGNTEQKSSVVYISYHPTLSDTKAGRLEIPIPTELINALPCAADSMLVFHVEGGHGAPSYNTVKVSANHSSVMLITDPGSNRDRCDLLFKFKGGPKNLIHAYSAGAEPSMNSRINHDIVDLLAQASDAEQNVTVVLGRSSNGADASADTEEAKIDEITEKVKDFFNDRHYGITLKDVSRRFTVCYADESHPTFGRALRAHREAQDFVRAERASSSSAA